MIYFSDFAAAIAATWQSIRTTLGASGGVDTGWHNFTLRLRYTAAGIADVPGATQFRLTLQGGSGRGIKIGACYVGLEGGTNFHFNGAQQQVFFGGSPTVTIPAGFSSSGASDAVTISVDGTAPIVVAFYFQNDPTHDTLVRLVANNSGSAYKVGNDAATTAATGYTTSALLQDTTLNFEAFG